MQFPNSCKWTVSLLQLCFVKYLYTLCSGSKTIWVVEHQHMFQVKQQKEETAIYCQFIFCIVYSNVRTNSEEFPASKQYQLLVECQFHRSMWKKSRKIVFSISISSWKSSLGYRSCDPTNKMAGSCCAAMKSAILGVYICYYNVGTEVLLRLESKKRTLNLHE